MPLQLTEVVDDAELPEIMDAQRAAFDDPPSRLMPLLYPELQPGPNARAAAMADGTARSLAIHHADPYSHWIKVTDPAAGNRVVGAARWVIAPENPFKAPPAVDAFWWPEGEQREFATICMRTFRAPRYAKMQRPHAFLNICFTMPEYRRRGVGRMMMDWGLQRADELGIPSYIDASAEGRPLYEACGFEAIEHHAFEAPRADPSPVWLQMTDLLLPYEWWDMLREPKDKARESEKR